MKEINTAETLLKHIPEKLLSKTLKKYLVKAYEALELGSLCISITDEDVKKLEGDFPSNNPLFNIETFQNESKFYIQKFWAIENAIFSKIIALQAAEKQNIEARKSFLSDNKEFIANKLFKKYNANNSGTEIDWQKVAALNAYLHNFAIITGGPGTGKTTTVAKLLYVLFLEAKGKTLQIELAAQTGKAAVRLKESLMNSAKDKEYGLGDLDNKITKCFDQIQPKTIHRLLGYIHNSIHFKHNKDNLLSADVLIIDEASMADAPLLSKLMEAVKPSARFYLLGDRNQLTSVEVGSVFSDLCLAKLDAGNDLSQLGNADVFNQFLSEEEKKAFGTYTLQEPSKIDNAIVELKRSYRFNDKQQIGILANDIIQQNAINFDDYSEKNGKEVQFLDGTASHKIDAIYSLFEAYIKSENINEALKNLNKVKILCALRRDDKFGTAAFNNEVERYLSNKGLLKPKETYYHNQPIMVSSNDNYLGLYNGDVGLIREDDKGELKAYFVFAGSDGKNNEIKSFTPAGIQSFDTAFAISIHKSQGSEFDTVLMVLPSNSEEKILTKELVYTGLTRAKEQAYILSPIEVYSEAVNQPAKRISGLGSRIQIQKIGAII